jgi:hypothetical protein
VIATSQDAIRAGIAAGVALGAWILVFLVFAAMTRARAPVAAPATMDIPGDEPPAVVGLLTNGWAVERESVPATLIDLAARGVVAIERTGPAQAQVRLLPNLAGDTALLPYERQVLDHLRSKAHEGVVPAGALTTGPDEESTRWWKAFRSQVIADARSRGLSRPRWHLWQVVLLAAAAIPGAMLAGLAIESLTWGSGSHTDVFWLGVGMTVVLTVLVLSIRSERDTDGGLAEAGRWLGLREHLRQDPAFRELQPAAVTVWDRYLGYAAAMGLAPVAVGALPMGAESRYHAWSAYGGDWHTVRVSYPRLRPGWGKPPALAILRGLAGATVAAGILVGGVSAAKAIRSASDSTAGLFSDPGTLWLIAGAGVVAAILGTYSLLMILYGFADLGKPKVVTGEVLRLRAGPGKSSDDHSRYGPNIYVAVDEGSSDRVPAWVAKTPLLAGISEGDVVQVEVTPLLRNVRSVSEVRAPG